MSQTRLLWWAARWTGCSRLGVEDRLDVVQRVMRQLTRLVRNLWLKGISPVK